MKTTVNNELSFLYPGHYHIMTEDDLRKFFSCQTNRMGIRDEKCHALVSVSWTNPGILNYLTDAANVLNGAVRSMKKNLKNYRQTEIFKSTVASKKAYGVRFEYTAKEKPVEQYSELIIFRVKNKFYSVYYISQKDLNSQNHPEFEAMLNSMSL